MYCNVLVQVQAGETELSWPPVSLGPGANYHKLREAFKLLLFYNLLISKLKLKLNVHSGLNIYYIWTS